MKVVDIIKCRYYSFEKVSAEEFDLHFKLMLEFINRGYGNIPVSSGGMGKKIFALEEEVCDEYERKIGIKK